MTTENANPNRASASALIERYASGGPILAFSLGGLSPEHEKARPGPGDWSLAELAAHLVDTDLVFADRIKRVLAEDDPVLVAFDENAWIAGLEGHDFPVDDAVSLFTANRRWIHRILARCSEAEFARAGRHTERGRMTLAELIVYVTNHLDHHLRFVYAKRANLGVAIEPRYTSH